MSLKLWLKELRIPFFTASLIPVFLGTAYAFYVTGMLDIFLFLLTLAGVVFLHAGTNLANDFFDFRSGNDVINTKRTPFSGGSGILPAGQLEPKGVHKLALIFFLLGGIIGLYLFSLNGIVVLILGLIGAISGYFYTSPKINFSSRGLGEFLVGLNFGVLVVLGAFFIQTGILSFAPIVISLPVAFLITGVLYINQFPDYEADKEVGKNNLVVMLGRERAVKGYEILVLLAYTSIILSVVFGFLPLLSLASLITIPLAVKSIRILRKHHSSFPEIIPANASTIMNHLFTGIILVVSVFISSFI